MKINNKEYPKVLIIGNTFDEYTGAGITLTNLFKEWPQSCIAVASNNLDLDYCNRCRPCHSYYTFGSNARRDSTPFIKNNVKSNSTIKNYLKDAVIKTGLLDFRNIYQLDSEFLSFYDEFNPDIVYSALGGVPIMRFFKKLNKVRNFRLVVHIWDEFLERFNNRWFCSLWVRYADNLFKKILQKEDIVCLAIGEKMAGEYEKRYHKKFS